MDSNLNSTGRMILVVFLLSIWSARAEIAEPLVTTPLGQVKGTVITSRLAKSIFSFRGIRYAKAPVNDLRFKPPVPVEKWEGIYNATEDGPLCPQPSSDRVSEDCLMLNVYSTKLPTLSENPLRPVIVYIHSGGLHSFGGASYWVGPNYLLDEDVVLVTFNFRLGTLGFLSTGDKEAPGNNGLRDQVEVLKWVRNNIEYFGGDPDSVTLMGYSSGAWCVNLHMVSPLSQGLFHKAVAMSGSILGPWPIPINQLEIAKKQARVLGCPDDTSSNIIKCLKTKSFHEIGESLTKFKEFGNDPIIIWSPVIEPDFGQARFLTAHPIQLITNGLFSKVPFMTGQTKDGYGYLAFNIVDNETLTQEINEKFDKNAPITFLYERNTDFSKKISKTIKSLYLEDKNIEKSQLKPLAELYADFLVNFGVNRAAKVISEHSNQSVFYYEFSYQGRYSHFYTPESNYTMPFGIGQHDDLLYLFYIQKLFPLFKENSPEEVEMVNKLTAIYANFAKTGNPIPSPSEKLDNVNWDRFTSGNNKYLEMGSKLVMKERKPEKRLQEWEKLYPLSMYQKNKHSH
ncbi:unnamed protein product [Phyllotreta striolata]|uniref:Carboxylic ester hydrolase n=1 Tax=Phyllotreta striolata TaxID=444603 RepID=A0A9N9TEL2_PHYSR|nr:unnamed protein product [Phyllotreta striolata]